jgi:hypothetical protein
MFYGSKYTAEAQVLEDRRRSISKAQEVELIKISEESNWLEFLDRKDCPITGKATPGLTSSRIKGFSALDLCEFVHKKALLEYVYIDQCLDIEQHLSNMPKHRLKNLATKINILFYKELAYLKADLPTLLQCICESSYQIAPIPAKRQRAYKDEIMLNLSTVLDKFKLTDIQKIVEVKYKDYQLFKDYIKNRKIRGKF